MNTQERKQALTEEQLAIFNKFENYTVPQLDMVLKSKTITEEKKTVMTLLLDMKTEGGAKPAKEKVAKEKPEKVAKEKVVKEKVVREKRNQNDTAEPYAHKIGDKVLCKHSKNAAVKEDLVGEVIELGFFNTSQKDWKYLTENDNHESTRKAYVIKLESGKSVKKRESTVSAI